MKHNIRRILGCAAAVLLLSIGLTGTASAACPAVGTVIYGPSNCSSPSSRKAPCYKFVVTSVSGGRIYMNKYLNRYYTWVYEGAYSSAVC